mmetsp:Transcript_22007/g.62551  ORF Transcript_22007/g.62551 Transcript_22007/m.62551 type:complete len:224 (+) Transcript_22007:420-1091(+)
MPSGQTIMRRSSKPVALNGDDTRALPMHPRNLAEKLPMRQSARTQLAPSTSPSATVTPSSNPTSASKRGKSEGRENGVAEPSSAEGGLSAHPTRGLPSSPMGSPLPVCALGLVAPESSPRTRWRRALCSSRSLRTSSRASLLKASSSVTLLWRPASVHCKYCTHCARDAACLAATSAWYAAVVALAACMAAKSGASESGHPGPQRREPADMAEAAVSPNGIRP